MKKLILFSILTVCLLWVGCSKDTGDTSTTEQTDGEHVHTWSEYVVIEEADCLYDGESERECTECGLRETITIEKTGHNCESFSYTQYPTFSKGGKMQGTCVNCGKKIREDAEPFKKEYKTVSANLSKVNNVYFNGYWKNGELAGSDGALTDMLGAEVLAKVSGASTVTYNFKLADANKSAVVAYSLDGAEWTRQDLKDNATLTVSVPEDETVVRVMYVGAQDNEQAICLCSVATDKGSIAPCVKNGASALVISDKISNLEKDTLSQASENLGYTSFRMSADGLGYNNFGAILDEYIAATDKSTVEPDYILLDLGANDADVVATVFTTAVSSIVEELMELYPNVDIYFVTPINGSKIGQLESVCTNYGIVSMLSTAEWSVTDASASSDKLCDFLTSTYGEKMYFDGLYESYKEPASPVFPDNKEDEPTYGSLFPLN